MNRITPLLIASLVVSGCAAMGTPYLVATPECEWNWYYLDLPDRTEQVKQALADVGVYAESVRVYDFGEVCETTGTTPSPSDARETNFEIKLKVDDATNLDDVGTKTLLVIDAVAPLLDKDSFIQSIRLSFKDPAGYYGGVRIFEGQAAMVESQGFVGAALMEYLDYAPTLPPRTETITPEVTIEVSEAPVTETPLPITPNPDLMACAFSWAYHDLPELNGTVKLALANAGIVSGVVVRVFDFGEDCVRQDGTSTFGAMETDFDILLNVDDAANLDDIAAKTLTVIQAVAPLLDKGSTTGVIRLSFSDLTGNHGPVRINAQQAAEIEAQGFTGPALMDYLQYNPQ